MPLVCATALPRFGGASDAPPRLQGLCARFETRAQGRLAPAQLAHCRRFAGQGAALRARASRLLARLLALRMLPPHAGLDMDDAGRPFVTGAPGWAVAFSHSGHAAFCLLAPPRETALYPAGSACAALDAEAREALPPGDRAFPAPAVSTAPALRRWVLAEALYKALGAAPDRWARAAAFAHAAAGAWPPGRWGVWHGEGAVLSWRLLPVPGHWLCAAFPGAPAHPVRLRWLPWQGLA